MNKKISAGLLSVLVLLPAAALTQEDPTQTAFADATFFVYSPDRESRADELINTRFKPHSDAAVEYGDILSWSRLQHVVGGKKWRRACEKINRIRHTQQDYLWDILVQTP